ncbi:MAG TPA: hypothetical protein VKK79_23125 [Candidatus Lokiarchaeia archaeon]|nr:hypothetical protein [Candidatus Lokiarchaeia archaeon]
MREFPFRKPLAYLLLGFSCILFVAYPLIGFYFETGSFSLEAFFTAPIYGNYRLTFAQMVLDVDQLIANFYTIILFCLVFAFFGVFYGPTSSELSSEILQGTYRRRVKLYGSVAAMILGIAILLSVLQLGYIRPELAGQTFALMFLNFHPENVSVQIFYYAFLFSGFPGVFYLIAQGKSPGRQAAWDGRKSNWGVAFFIVAVAIVEILLVVYPFIPWVVVNSSTAVREIFFSLWDIFFLTGTVLLIDIRDHQKSALIYHDNTPKPPISDTSGSKWSRYRKHAYIWGIICLGFFVTLGILLLVGGMTIKIGTAYFISRVWSFGFTVTFSLFLVSYGRLMVLNHGQGGTQT